MKIKICFATNNKNKIREVKQLLGSKYEILSLEEIGCHQELPETRETIEGNSLQKAEYVYEHNHVNCFADDTGLEVNALNGEPGVYSARYAGLQKSNEDNIRLLLKKLEGREDRSARFRTVISIIINGKKVQVEGIVNGQIVKEPSGDKGFGYDPVFVPEGHTLTFAQMGLEQKNQISHRAKAIFKLVEYLGKIEEL